MFIRAPHMIAMCSQGREPQIEGFEIDGWSHHDQLTILTSWGILNGGNVRGSLRDTLVMTGEGSICRHESIEAALPVSPFRLSVNIIN